MSVVVPVYGVADYLPACLDSLLGDNDDLGLEVIAVDDASPDSAGELLDDRAARDPRLRVVHLDHNSGQGNARNLGLSLARGDFVWFVDADDSAAGGALPAIAAALAAAKPDVLLINWISVFPGGRTAPNPYASLLAAVPREGCTLEDQPQLVNLTMTSWSKVFRREFLVGLGVSFAAGIHEDIVVSCAALLSADAIAAVRHVCYRYRRQRPGSAMATTSHAQWAVFTAYERVFELLADRAAAGHPPSARLQAAIFERAIEHYTTVLETTGPGIGRVGLPGLVPRGERRQFFQRMHEDFQRYQPDSYQHPDGPRGMKLRLVELGAYRRYSLLEPLNQARVAVRKAAQRRVRRSRRNAGSPC
jgi:CDP-glycerol glycerophosphotransferase